MTRFTTIYDELGNFYFEFPYVGEDERRLAISKAKNWAANLASFQPDQRELLSDGTTSPQHTKQITMKQQTAISWLRKKLEETYDKEGKLPLAYTLYLVEQAKQMEKEQIVKAYSNGSNDRLKNRINEQYYNETYGGQGSPDTSPNTQNK